MYIPDEDIDTKRIFEKVERRNEFLMGFLSSKLTFSSRKCLEMNIDNKSDHCVNEKNSKRIRLLKFNNIYRTINSYLPRKSRFHSRRYLLLFRFSRIPLRYHTENHDYFIDLIMHKLCIKINLRCENSRNLVTNGNEIRNIPIWFGQIWFGSGA